MFHNINTTFMHNTPSNVSRVSNFWSSTSGNALDWLPNCSLEDFEGWGVWYEVMKIWGLLVIFLSLSFWSSISLFFLSCSSRSSSQSKDIRYLLGNTFLKECRLHSTLYQEIKVQKGTEKLVLLLLGRWGGWLDVAAFASFALIVLN